MLKRWLALFLLCGCTDAADRAAGGTYALPTLLAKGAVQLVSSRGTGGSTGTVVESRLFNATERPLKVAVSLAPALYLVNRGRGQNMVATEV